MSVTDAPDVQANDAGTIMAELLGLARGLDKAANRLARATKEFEGASDEVVDEETGEVRMTPWKPGPQLRYESAVTVAEGLVMDQWPETKRPPAQDRLHRLAEEYVAENDPELYADYHRLKSEIAALQKWISARKDSISARQSVLSAERAITR